MSTPQIVPDFLKRYSTRYLIDTLGFEKHMRQIRMRRSEAVPDAWYDRPYGYGLRLDREKIKGDGDTLYFPASAEKKDYEFEIVAFFSQPVKTANIEDAIAFTKTHLWFTIMNDTSCRDAQASDTRLPLWVGPSKGIADKAFGPVWVPAEKLIFDENGVPDLHLRLFVNGLLRCDDHFRSIYFTDPKSGKRLCWGFAQVIAWLGSLNQGFEEGDLLGSGTIGNGSIAEACTPPYQPDAWIQGNTIYPWLEEGDIVTMKVDEIGTLVNRIGVLPPELEGETRE